MQDLERADYRVNRERTKDVCICASRENTCFALGDLKLFFSEAITSLVIQHRIANMVIHTENIPFSQQVAKYNVYWGLLCEGCCLQCTKPLGRRR